jgi:cytidine deaminase
MDDADYADLRTEAALEMAVASARNAPRELQPCGHCHWCMSELPRSDQLFCDSLCAKDWASNKQRNGG